MSATIETSQDHTTLEITLEFRALRAGIALPLRNLRIRDILFCTALPENLVHIDLLGNRLEYIPHIIFECANLRTLTLSHNNITEVPDAIQKLTALYELELLTNNLVRISPAIGMCSKLAYINLGKNNLETVPQALVELPQLTHLYVHDNKLSSVPKLSTLLARGLHALCLSGNPLTAAITRAHANPNDIRELRLWFRKHWFLMYFGLALRCTAPVLMSVLLYVS